MFFFPFSISSIRAWNREREKERERGHVRSRRRIATRLNEKKGARRGGELRGEGDWFRGINPLMLDVHAPRGTTSAGYVHPRDFHNLNCKSIRPPIAASEFMQSAPVPRLSLSRRPLRETSHGYRRVPRIYLVFYALENPFEDVVESPGCGRGEGRGWRRLEFFVLGWFVGLTQDSRNMYWNIIFFVFENFIIYSKRKSNRLINY